MQRIEGLSIDLGLETAALNRGLTGLKDKLKTVNAEMKSNLSSFDRADRSVEKYQTRLTGLTRKLEIQKAVVRASREEYERMTREFGAGSKESELAARGYHNQQANLNNLQRDIQRTTTELSRLEREQQRSTNSWERLSQRMSTTGEAFSTVGGKMRDVGRSLSFRLTAPLVGIGIAALKTGMEFEQGMSRVAALSGATGDDFKKLQKQAEELGAATKFSATEAASGQEFLALAGFKTNQIISAMPGLLSLAAAGALDLGKAADIASNIMSAFGIEAGKAGHVADVLAQAATTANTSVEQLGEAMKPLAPVAHALGWTVEQSASAVMALSDAGLQGERAGTAFATSLGRLAKPTGAMKKVIDKLGISFFDAQENMKSMPDVVGEVEKATAGMTMKQKSATLTTLFGAEAYKHWAILLDKGSGALRENTKILEKSDGAAKKMADTMTDNSLGAIEEFTSSIENLSIQFTKRLLPPITELIKKVTNWIDKLAEASPKTQKMTFIIAGLAAAAGPTVAILGLLASSIGNIMKFVAPLLSIMGGGGGFLGILQKIPGPVGLVATGLGLAAGGFALYKGAVEESKKVNLDHASSLVEQSAKLSDLTGKYDALREKNQLSNNELLRFRDINSELNLATSADEIARLKDEQAKLQEKSGLTNEELSTMFGLNDDLIAQAPTVDQTYSDRGNAIINNRDGLKQANDELREQLRLELENQRIKADAKLDQAIRDQIVALQELGNLDAKLDAARAERDAQRLTVKQAEKTLEDAIRSGNQATITIAENELMLQKGILVGLDTEVSTRADVVGKQQESVKKSQETIAKTQELYNKLIDLQLAQAGINAKGDEGIAQLNQTISQNQQRVGELKRAREQQGGLNRSSSKRIENPRANSRNAANLQAGNRAN